MNVNNAIEKLESIDDSKWSIDHVFQINFENGIAIQKRNALGHFLPDSKVDEYAMMKNEYGDHKKIYAMYDQMKDFIDILGGIPDMVDFINNLCLGVLDNNEFIGETPKQRTINYLKELKEHEENIKELFQSIK
jgi:hypothetical protein